MFQIFAQGSIACDIDVASRYWNRYASSRNRMIKRRTSRFSGLVRSGSAQDVVGSYASKHNGGTVKVKREAVALRHPDFEDASALRLHLLDLKGRMARVLDEEPKGLVYFVLKFCGEVFVVADEGLAENQLVLHTLSERSAAIASSASSNGPRKSPRESAPSASASLCCHSWV